MPFIAAAEHTDDLVPTKTESVYIKKRSVDCHCAQLPETGVISRSTSAVAAFPMVERTASRHLHTVREWLPTMSSVSLWMFLYLSMATVWTWRDSELMRMDATVLEVSFSQ